MARERWPGRRFVQLDVLEPGALDGFDVVMASALLDVLAEVEPGLDALLASDARWLVLHRQRIDPRRTHVEVGLRLPRSAHVSLVRDARAARRVRRRAWSSGLRRGRGRRRRALVPPGARVITVFSIPKAFSGEIAVIQRNAVRSWRALGPDVQVVLLGAEEGVSAAAHELGVEHIADVALNDHGTPRLDDAFRASMRSLRHPPPLLRERRHRAARRLPAGGACGAGPVDEAFLIVGASLNLRVDRPLDLGESAERRALRARAGRGGRSRGATAIDYFVFPRASSIRCRRSSSDARGSTTGWSGRRGSGRSSSMRATRCLRCIRRTTTPMSRAA